MKQNKHNPDALSYKLVTGTQWAETYKSDYLNAVHNADKTEYILSCNDGSGEYTRKQAQEYIANNWTQEAE